MALHFSEQELSGRRRAACDAMAARGLDGLLMFRQESMYYLTGYDTFGYVFFQCLYLGADGAQTLLTRSADLRQARHTSTIEDVRVWMDAPDANPPDDLRAILDEHGCRGKKLGVEYEAYGLTARNGKRLDAALDGFCALEDASMLVTELRVVKSPEEIEYVRKAAELADDAWDVALKTVKPGDHDGVVLGHMQNAVFQGGGEYSGNEFICGSGRDALLCRSHAGRRVIEAKDQITLEWAGSYMHYHAAMMRTICIGGADGRQRRMHAVALEALEAVRDAVKPGNTFGDGFDAHARVMDAAGMRAHRLNACGYSLGATFAPSWMDWPMMHHGNPAPFLAGQVVFCHMILMDSDSEQAMTLGETVLVTEIGHERLSRSGLELPAV